MTAEKKSYLLINFQKKTNKNNDWTVFLISSWNWALRVPILYIFANLLTFLSPPITKLSRPHFKSIYLHAFFHNPAPLYQRLSHEAAPLFLFCSRITRSWLFLFAPVVALHKLSSQTYHVLISSMRHGS